MRFAAVPHLWRPSVEPTNQSDSMNWEQAYFELVQEILKLLQVLNSPVTKTGHAQLPSGPVTIQHREAP
jgi:hypothetical protein